MEGGGGVPPFAPPLSSLPPSPPPLHPAPFLHRSILCLDEILLLVLCSGVASLCVDDGRVGVGGVVRALGLVGQIRSCGQRERTDREGERGDVRLLRQ